MPKAKKNEVDSKYLIYIGVFIVLAIVVIFLFSTGSEDKGPINENESTNLPVNDEPANVEEGFKFFQSQEKGFSINYPAAWSANEAGDIVSFTPSGSSASLKVTTEDLTDSGFDYKSYGEAYADSLRDLPETRVLGSNGDFSFYEKAWEVKYTQENKKYSTLIVIHNEMGYIIEFGTTIENYNNEFFVYSNAVDSFEFLN